MCLGTPKVPDPQPQIDESRRQFDVEQQRLSEREAAQTAEAERQRVLEQQRMSEQLAAEEAQRAREAEAARQKQLAIDNATTAVNQGFSGFDDNYFKSFTEDYLGFYNPKIQQQAEDARKEAQFELARRGTLDSSAAVDVYGRLAEQQQEEEARIAREAASAASGLRSSVATSRSNLLEQAINSGGQGDFVSLAQQTAEGIRPPEFQPIGELFAGLMSTPAASGQGGASAEGLAAQQGAAPAQQSARLVLPQKRPRKQTAGAAASGLVF